MSTYQQTTLANGLTVASEYMPSVESASVGVYIRTGSRAETVENNGVAHFLEHMLFLGTETNLDNEKRVPISRLELGKSIMASSFFVSSVSESVTKTIFKLGGSICTNLGKD